MDSHHDYASALGLERLDILDYGPNAGASGEKICNALRKYGYGANTPLWLYVLMEPFAIKTRRMKLGKLASIIVGEQFRSLLVASPHSILAPEFDPESLRLVESGAFDWDGYKPAANFFKIVESLS